ncbi:MAG: ABC-F family ATP-binding cassette domain-containing protein [Firmicutes bacterium]|nr:ABC-F family ATP-binding cassette domain-containing protein [Bacillota bacterium]
MGLINFTDIRKAFNNQEVLKGVSFSIEKGERVALVGPNGAGKTTLLRIAQGLETADSGSATFARGVIPGVLTQDLSQLAGETTALEWREIVEIERKLRMLEGEIAAAAGNVGDLMKQYDRLTARYEAIDGYTMEIRLKNMLLGLGLKEETLLTSLNLLSSGEKMRAALARVLLKQPDLLLLDEPTNHLDIGALEWLEDFLIRFEGGVLFISHDRYFLNRVATRVVELSGGTILEHKGSYANFMKQKEIRRQHAMDETARLRYEIKNKKKHITMAYNFRRHTALHMYEKQLARLEKEKADIANEKISGHLDYGRSASINLDYGINRSKRIAEAVDAAKAFGDMVLFENVNFLVSGGDRVGIVGTNGCGKTTLLRMLLGRDSNFTGRCSLGQWVKYVFIDQNASFEDENRTSLQEIHACHKLTEREARDALAAVGLYEDEYRKPISVLSGGERVRLKLGLAMLDKPQCLILDEPTNHLDLPAREAVEEALAQFPGSVIAVSHDRSFLNTCVNKLFIMENRQLTVFDGNWNEYQQSKNAPAKVINEKAKAQKKPAKPAVNDILPAKIKALEEEISFLEQAKADLEKLFEQGESIPEQSDYEEYGIIDGKLTELYAEWEALIE